MAEAHSTFPNELRRTRKETRRSIGEFPVVGVLPAHLLEPSPERPSNGPPPGTNIYLLPVGTDLPENDLTSYETLGDLITRYNREVTAHQVGDTIDTTTVSLRDALAHGRVSAINGDEQLRLLKFDRPVKGRVRITFNEVMDEAWFKKQTARVYDCIQRVHSAYQTLAGLQGKP